MIKDYTDLKIWQEGRCLVKDIYLLTNDYPDTEKFGLVAQMRRAVTSIPSNIAEGFNRRNVKEYRHFLYIALGSCAELSTQLTLSYDLEYITENCFNRGDNQVRQLSKMIKSLSKKLIL